MKNQKRLLTGIFLFLLFCIVAYHTISRNETNALPSPNNDSVPQTDISANEESLEIADSDIVAVLTPDTQSEPIQENSDTEAGAAIETQFSMIEETTSTDDKPAEEQASVYLFRNQELFNQHFIKHGNEFGEISQEEYLVLANKSIASLKTLQKKEADGDLLFYEQETNTFTVLSKDGFIRTCFKPDDGIDYWNRQ